MGLLLLEDLAIAAGYVLLGWFGQYLRLGGQLILVWPAGGFALAMLLLRGTSRWPAILLGSVIVTQLWVLEGGGSSLLRGYLPALLAGLGRSLSAVAGAYLIRRLVGPARWPCSLRGVIGFGLIAGLLYPVLASVTTYATQLLGGPAVSPPFRYLWAWSIANSTGTLLVAPLLLALTAPPCGLPSRSRWEAALLSVLQLGGYLVAFIIARKLVLGGVMAYPVAPLMLWAAHRFGSRGAVLSNLAWSSMIIAASLSQVGETEVARAFFEVQMRVVVISLIFLSLAAVVEERIQMHEALEKERQGLEQRVHERTRELAHSLSLLHSSLESTADGLLVVDRLGRITAMNQRFAQLWGIPRSSLESGDDTRALAVAQDQVADPKGFLSRVAYLYEHPELESEDEIALKDGRVFERFSRPQRLGEEIIGRVWSFRDVTLRRRAEAERDRLLVEESRARQTAEEASRKAHEALGLRDEFLAIAAHEMKTPLTSMKAQVQHLERLLAREPTGSGQDSRLRSVLAATSRQLRRLQILDEQLLDITRLTLGRLELRYEPLDFQEFLQEQLEQNAEAASKATSELRLECAGPIPGAWDRLRLEQIVGNLISNAIKFGAGKPITLRLDARGDRVRLQVIDSGIGIAVEDHRRIFERLERAVDSRHYGGLGMGLWIVRQSVEALGGDITVESAPGQGATFTVELPRMPQAPFIEEEGHAVTWS
ncbi:MAG: ATP-binding protein [Hyalangium sp.]|uniref:sensor histidine kinase n=1 Tax=Hyalangium sp. TaxID=2028555 RepID=UPI00389A145C